MQKSMEGFSERVMREDGSKSKGLSSIIFRRNNASVSGNSKPAGSTAAVERVWKSEEIILEHGIETPQVRHLKKSQSLGDELYFDGRDAKENGTDGITSPNSLEQSATLAAGSSKRVQGSLNLLYEKAPGASVSVYQGSDQAHYGSIFSVGDRHHADEDSRHLDDTSLSGEQMDNSNGQTPNDSPLMVRSNSMPNIADSASEKSSPSKYSSHHSRSSDAEVKQDQERSYDMHKSGDNDKENLEDDGYDYPSLAKDWIVPPKDELKLTQYLEGETSNQQAEFPGKDFKIKRIEDWVSDLQHVNLSEEADEITGYEDDELPREHVVLNEPPTTASVVKLTPGMEAAKKYISSLSASATTAQLVNHGLVVIPFLSAFVSLRVLNLSGNAIGKACYIAPPC